MSELKVLIEGYARQTNTGWLASATTTLIRDSGKTIIVDPGVNKELLLSRLGEEGLTVDDIDIVFLTHYHIDHSFLAAIFSDAIVLDGDTIYEKDSEVNYEGKIPNTEVSVIATPGHAHEHACLVVNTNDGKIVVAADVFWWLDNEPQITDEHDLLLNKDDPFVKDKTALLESRKQVLAIADLIIPGHGKMFRNLHKNN